MVEIGPAEHVNITDVEAGGIADLPNTSAIFNLSRIYSLGGNVGRRNMNASYRAYHGGSISMKAQSLGSSDCGT
jgi:hypothetical protein